MMATKVVETKKITPQKNRKSKKEKRAEKHWRELITQVTALLPMSPTRQRDDAHVSGFLSEVFVTKVCRLQSQEEHIAHEVPSCLAHRVARRGVAHILSGQHRQGPAIYSNVLKGGGELETSINSYIMLSGLHRNGLKATAIAAVYMPQQNRLQLHEKQRSYLCGCQEGKHKEDCRQWYNLRSSFTLKQQINRPREIDHEEAQQVLCGDQP